MLMHKYLNLTIALIIFVSVISVPRSAMGAEAEWKIQWGDNQQLLETVTISGTDIQVDDHTWKTTQTNGRLILSREVQGWDSYTKLNDRLPLQVNSRNFLILKMFDLKIAPYESNPKNLYANLSGLDNINIIMEVSGIIRESSADEVIDSKATWKFQPNDDLLPEGPMLKIITFNGFLIAVLLVLIALMVIGMVYVRGVRRVNALLEEEYSIENLTPLKGGENHGDSEPIGEETPKKIT